MNACEQIQKILQSEENLSFSPVMREQQRRVNEGIRLVDDLVQKGIIDPPSYRLSPINTLPLGVPSYFGEK